MAQVPWTSEQDEQLLHIRDVAQLQWRNIVTYFPDATLLALKRRYKQLNNAKTTRQAVSTQQTSRVRGRKRAAFRPISTRV